ncbi:MAG: helix-turn-helix transcriptional regulator [Rikenellaceae bacterium]|nr:helix-turn-helix transcriptional regulator [Rikenellaceae bacterium]
MLNLRQFAFDLKIQQTELVKVLGIAQSQVSNMMNGFRKVRPDHIEKLRAKYGDIVDNYRTDGVEVKPAEMSPAPTSTANDVRARYSTIQSIPAVEITPPPLVPEKIVRDPSIEVLDWVNSREIDHSQNAFNIASILRRTKFVIQMNNSAMSPTLYQNEYVFLKPFASTSEIIDGEIYGIETASRGVLIRFLYNDGDYYLARPKNTREFGDLRIPKNGANLFHIVFHGSPRLSSLPDNEGEMIEQLARQGDYISSLIDEVGKAGQRVDRLIDMVERK